MPGPGSKQRGKKFPAEILTRDEIDLLMKTISNRAPTQIRNKALIYVGYRCGLRISEALALLPKDVDLKSGTVNVLRGKGVKQRMVGIPDDAIMALTHWIQKRGQLGCDGKQPLFCSLEGRPLHTSYVRAALRRLQRRSGIEKRLHFHILRHTCSFELMKEGKNLMVIQGMLGHASLATTSIYLSHIAPWDIITAMQDR